MAVCFIIKLEFITHGGEEMVWFVAIRGVEAKDFLHGDVFVDECIGQTFSGCRVDESGHCPVNNGQAYLPVRKLTPLGSDAEAAAFVAELVQAEQVYLLEESA